MIRKMILITLIIAIFLVGCQKAEESKEKQETTTPEAVETLSETTPEISIESEIAEIDSLDKELNLEDLDGIESELDEINW